MAPDYRNTLKAHAHALSSLGAALADLGHEHRVAASAMERRSSRGDVRFDDWIATAAEISATAERLLELEVELARRYGVTWERIADALGVSRQSAWERFRTHSRWDRARNISRLRRARRAAMLRRMALGQSDEFAAYLRHMMRSNGTSSTVGRTPAR